MLMSRRCHFSHLRTPASSLVLSITLILSYPLPVHQTRTAPALQHTCYSNHFAAGDDWTLSEIVPIFSAACFLHGLSAAVFGRWQERVGPRLSGMLGAVCFGGGVALGGYGILVHSLPLVYMGYGVLGGCGLGLSYVPPVAALVRWFPDKRGLATGLTVMGFGGGALLVAPATVSAGLELGGMLCWGFCCCRQHCHAWLGEVGCRLE